MGRFDSVNISGPDDPQLVALLAGARGANRGFRDSEEFWEKAFYAADQAADKQNGFTPADHIDLQQSGDSVTAMTWRAISGVVAAASGLTGKDLEIATTEVWQRWLEGKHIKEETSGHPMYETTRRMRFEAAEKTHKGAVKVIINDLEV